MPITKPGLKSPGICLLSRGFFPRGCGRSCARFWLDQKRDHGITGSSVVGGAAGAGTWGQVSIGTFLWVRGTLCDARKNKVDDEVGDAVDGVRAAVRSTATPGTSEIRRECWSRGRIVSALLCGAQGGCLPSVEPPNPVAITMALPLEEGNRRSAFDTARYRRQ
jgi:hypothetical protein